MVLEDVALLAQSVLPRFAETALRLSIKLVSSILSEAATGSTIACSNLETLEEHDKDYRAQLKIILALIENLHRKGFQPCRGDLPDLHRLFKLAGDLESDRNADKNLERNLAAANKEYAAARERNDKTTQNDNILARLSHAFAKLNKPLLQPTEITSKGPPRTPEDYPSLVNDQLYNVLRENLECSCEKPCASPNGHRFTRLCLQPQGYQQETEIVFDIHFSQEIIPRSPKIHWQQVRFFLPSKQMRSKGKVTFHEDKPKTQNLPEAPDSTVKAEEFREWLDRCHGAVWMSAHVRGGEILPISDPDAVGELLDPCASVSLEEALLQYQLTAKMKLVLAYILAHSVWRFYNSNWTKATWSAKTIHFMKIQVPNARGTKLFACNPCFAVQFHSNENILMEYYDGMVAHRYPRLLSLGELLLDLGCSQPILCCSGFSIDGLDQYINNNCAMSLNILKYDDEWPYLGTFRDASVKGRYKEITRACFDKRTLIPLTSTRTPIHGPSKEPQNTQTVEERRHIIYNRIVSPLADLLDDLGWKSALEKIEPMDEINQEGLHEHSFPLRIKMPLKSDVGSIVESSVPAKPNLSMESNSRTTMFLGHSPMTSPDRSKTWLEQVRNSYRLILQRHATSFRSEKYSRTKIAVLDTGYDPQAEFFNHRDRKSRLRAWRDWTKAGVTSPRDEDGHGSKILSLVMKVAPMAEVFIGRIAKDSNELERSSETIADAITWASAECEADIVCMAFGFVDEEVVAGQKPLRKAIYRATTDRDERILFVAAAGNDGANSKEIMFPARHGLVIPVYGTDATGAFLEDLNPRIKRDGPAIFGTLAKDVPCSGRDDETEMFATGTSFATAIVAGFAGMLLEYAHLLALRKEETGEVPNWRANLSTKGGMLAMFKQIAQDPPDRRYYLHPIHFLQQAEEYREAIVTVAAKNAM